jgi:hypothetical protein
VLSVAVALLIGQWPASYKTQGLRMGLAISRSIVENHHGKLWAETNDGLGITFQLTLAQYHTTDAPMAGQMRGFKNTFHQAQSKQAKCAAPR